MGNGLRKKEEGICDTRRARWKEEQKRAGQVAGAGVNPAAKHEGRRTGT